MSCALALLAAFALSPAEAAAQAYPSATPTPQVQVASAAPAPLISEPLFSDIANRADSLAARTTGWMTSDSIADVAAFRSDVARLSALDMEGHLTLAARGTDPDLKCMLRGMSNDLTAQMTIIDGAADPAARRVALQRLHGLLDDNASVLRAPSRPPV